ncbi:MAG: hypothetical protein INR70_00440 [Parafilimonas terrae]|nr:hypothetical protein [Parafilimonas terrae]
MFPLQIDTLGGSKNFESIEELRSFISEQIAAYSWLRGVPNPPSHDIAVTVLNGLEHTLMLTHNWPNNYNSAQMLSDQLRNMFGQNGLPVAGSPTYALVEEIRKEQGDKAAIGALAFYAGRIPHTMSDSEMFSGTVSATLRHIGLSRQGAVSARRSFDSLSGQIQHAHDNFEKSLASYDNTAKLSRSRSSRKASTQRRWDHRKFHNQMQEFASAHKSALDEFNNMRKTYEELMALKAPVDYWRDKAKHHRAESIRYRTALIEWSKVLIPSVMFVLLCLSGISFLFVQADKPATSYLILVTLGVVATTIAFWAARILVRLYMSEHHLSIDADERATMVMTYLALTERGAAEEKDRALILAPLFRPSSDGIVKDDAAPDLSPASLLSKITSR